MVIIIIAINYNKQNVINAIQESFHGGNIVGFLDKNQGCQLLKSSKYFTTFNKQDKIKRNLASKNTSQILDYYCNNILEFTSDEKKAMNWLINLIVLHNDENQHALKEVDSAALAVAKNTDEIVNILNYTIKGCL